MLRITYPVLFKYLWGAMYVGNAGLAMMSANEPDVVSRVSVWKGESILLNYYGPILIVKGRVKMRFMKLALFVLLVVLCFAMPTLALTDSGDPLDILGGMWELVGGETEGGDFWTATETGFCSTMTFDAGLAMADFWMNTEGTDESYVGMKVKIIHGEGLYADCPNQEWHFEMDTDDPNVKIRGSVWDGELTVFKYTIFHEEDFAIINTLIYQKISDTAAMG